MKKCILLLFFCFVFIQTFAQKTNLNSVLIFSKPTAELRYANQIAIENFYKSSLAHHTKFDTTSNPQAFIAENLKKYNCLVFLNTSANVLTYPQIVEFQRYLQAKGGFVGIRAAAEKNYTSIWYQNFMAAKTEESSTEKMQFSIITNANLGKTEVQPFWKIEDKPLIISQLASKCKPVLLDINGKTWAYHYTSDEGGKMFYTAFGNEAGVYQNPDFMAHLWAGIEEVSSQELPDFSKVSSAALPNEKFFLTQILTTNLKNPTAFVTLPNNNCLISQQDGTLQLYEAESRNLKFLTKNEVVGSTKKMKLDPDFAQNGFVYAFLETNKANEFQVKRFQLIADSTAILSDFSSNSTAPINDMAKYNFANFEGKAYRFPKYYDGKSFRFIENEGFKIESFDDDGNLKNLEPFLTNTTLKHPKNFDFGIDGALYLFDENNFVKIDYSEKNRPPVAIIRADIIYGKPPLKVRFSAADSYDLNNDLLTFSWRFDDKNISSELEPEFTFTKPAIYNVKLQVTDNQGLMAEKVIQIDVVKAGKTVQKERKH